MRPNARASRASSLYAGITMDSSGAVAFIDALIELIRPVRRAATHTALSAAQIGTRKAILASFGHSASRRAPNPVALVFQSASPVARRWPTAPEVEGVRQVPQPKPESHRT